MSDERRDHDQRIKTLLRTYLPEFFECFLPSWAETFERLLAFGSVMPGSRCVWVSDASEKRVLSAAMSPAELGLNWPTA